MKVMRSVVEKYGVFKTLYVDRAGIFGGPKRCNFSQMQRACEELGIEIIFASSPQGKGRIERAFDEQWTMNNGQAQKKARISRNALAGI